MENQILNFNKAVDTLEIKKKKAPLKGKMQYLAIITNVVTQASLSPLPPPILPKEFLDENWDFLE